MKFNLRASFICAALVTAAPLVFAENSQRPVAVVAGQAIYEQDLMSVAGARLLEARNQEYKLKKDALDTLVRKKLVEVEATKRGVSVDQLLTQEVDSKIPEPSDAEAKGYYLAVKSDGTISFDAVKQQVKQMIRNTEIQQARQKYEDSLRANAEFSVLMRAPSVQIDYDPARVKGDPNAPVTMIEFADFQCPYCQKTEATVNAVLAKYKGRVKLAFLDFPLTEIHAQAEKAAEAAHCAAEQGKFWEYHDSLFAEQSKLDEQSLTGRAQNLHLDESAFRSCLTSGKFKGLVEANRQQGARFGVAGTPAYFINGVFLSGAQPQAEFEKIIDNELAAQGNNSQDAP